MSGGGGEWGWGVISGVVWGCVGMSVRCVCVVNGVKRSFRTMYLVPMRSVKYCTNCSDTNEGDGDERNDQGGW